VSSTSSFSWDKTPSDFAASSDFWISVRSSKDSFNSYLGTSRHVSARLGRLRPVDVRVFAGHECLATPFGSSAGCAVERFHQTMAREWAYGIRYRSHRHRAAALPHWLRYYNERRPHSSFGGLPPISRVHNVCGHDT
jgi:hypothetical protein